MAGIEQLEILSKSYIVRWVRVSDHHTLSWSVQPHKKSINFGIVKHPGAGATGATGGPGSPQAIDGEVGDLQASDLPDTKIGGPVSRRDNGNAQDLLAAKGLIPIKWYGKYEADFVAMDTHDVPADHGGMYGLVFDNTFSKKTSKLVTFVLLTYPTGAPPQSNHLASITRASHPTSIRYSNVRLNDSLDSLHSQPCGGAAQRDTSTSRGSNCGTATTSYYAGIMYKRRRKKGQGYARRFFSLDFNSCSLSYYHDRTSSSLRGSIPLSLAAIAADQERKEISIDSGAEIWHLKTQNATDFSNWAAALEKASRIARGLEVPQTREASATTSGWADSDLATQALSSLSHLTTVSQSVDALEDAEWLQVETLVSRLVGTRDALRRFIQDHLSQKLTSNLASSGISAVAEESDSHFVPAPDRRPFWKRKYSAVSSPLTTHGSQSTSNTLLTIPLPASAPLLSSNGFVLPPQTGRANARANAQIDSSVREHCTAILQDLDFVAESFTTLMGISKRRSIPPVPLRLVTSRTSIDTTRTDEFFDAEVGGDSEPQIVRIDRNLDDLPSDEEGMTHESGSRSSMDEGSDLRASQVISDLQMHYPQLPKSLAPLPIAVEVQRRKTVPLAKGLPPSLIGLVRKNVGKDLSTISVPVSANEPISLLQKVAEQLEYAELLDQAAREDSATERLVRVAAFAVSQLSSSRARERALRKPFNPLLGETFELLRSEKEIPGGMRVLVEKVCHRPVRLALQADSARWSLSQAPAPSQKFWGKSAEITTEGKVRLTVRLADGSEERYWWNMPTMFLRNVVMGEKYVEPAGTMQVVNDTTGARASIEFRSKGMFGGRSEDVHVIMYGPDGRPTGSNLAGTWTDSLRIGEHELWKVGQLVDGYALRFGMTAFAATLNEITALEQSRLPPTDSRLRKDQRLMEEGNLDEAEIWKGRLEEAQRTRRRELEERGESHQPLWFVCDATTADGEEVWRLKTGKDGYWDERARQTWTGVTDIFAL